MSGRPERTTYMTSGKHHADPEPWVFTGTSTRTSFKGAWGLMQDYAPRPDFDNHNPVLVSFRQHVQDDHSLVEESERWLRDMTPERITAGSLTAVVGLAPWSLNPEHIEHARRVLQKLAAVYA